MKRIFWITLILALFAALVSCGGEVATTTKAPAVTQPTTTTQKATVETTKPIETEVTTPAAAPETTLPETTPVTTPVTTAPDTTPVDLEPTSISYSISQSGYFYTQFDEAGRTAVRYLYDRETMQKTDKEYHYTYDDSGKLETFAIWNGDVGVQFALSYSDDGRTVMATDVTDESYQYEIVLDENGKIVSETILESGVSMFRFEYDEKGYVVLEIMYFRGMGIEYESFYDGDTALITCVLENAATQLCVTYNEWGYPISLEGHQLSTEYWYLYTYNRNMLCETANFMDSGYEFYYEFSYDERGNVIKILEENDEAISEKVYAYDDADRVIRTAVKNSAHSGELNYFYVTTSEFDDNGYLVKVVSYEDGDETDYISKWTYVYTYNEQGLMVEDKVDYTTNKNGFIASFKDFYEYDEFGREIKFTMVEYTENGNVMYTTVHETFFDEDGSVIKKIVSYYNAAGILTDQTVTDYTA